MQYPPLLIFSGLGWPEILLILLVILLLFGAKRIPEIMRSFGAGVKEFKKGVKEVNRELEGEEEEEERNSRHSSPPAGGGKNSEGEKPSHGEEA